MTCVVACRNLGFSYALLAHISQQARGGDGLSQVPRSQLLRARDSALSAYVNCRGAQPAVVQVRGKNDFALKYWMNCWQNSDESEVSDRRLQTRF
jgi:hypothetical protein